MQVSQFTCYAVGTAAENKALKSKTLKVTPHEQLPFLDGELRENPTPLAYASTDADGLQSQGQVFSDNVVEALWLPENSNRVTAPDIRRGERILLYRYGDAEQIYWRPMGLDEHLRKLETVVLAISANPTEGNEVLDPSQCYFIEISSHLQHIVLQTCKAGGELVAYTLKLDMAAGQFVMMDDMGNHMFMDSQEAHLRLMNYYQSLVEMNKRKVRIKGDEEVLIESGGTRMSLTPGGTVLKTPRFDGDT